jgi:predicted nucleotidyltransferase component of viral defense system
MGSSTLDSFQHRILESFFDREQRFFLTGGAALAGFHLGHRRTLDLDLFTLEEVLEDGVAALREVAHDLGASVESLRTAPDFHRFLVTKGSASVVVDLVFERAPQIAEKMRFGRISVDPPEEILANKLCTLLSRAELRDLVDVWALEKAGYPLEASLEPAARKDGGLTAGQLAWVLSEIEIGDDADPPGASAEELRAYLQQLVGRLTRLAHP